MFEGYTVQFLLKLVDHQRLFVVLLNIVLYYTEKYFFNKGNQFRNLYIYKYH